MAIEAPNMYRLRRAIQDSNGYAEGATIYGIGDPDHMSGSSDHNPDDTPGVRTPQTDADHIAEWRALDAMVRGSLTFQKADKLAKHLASHPDCRARLLNVIWNRKIASRSWGWTWRDYSGSNPHTDHVHISGLVSQDANNDDWPTVRKLGMGGEAEEVTQEEFNTLMDEYARRTSGIEGTSPGQRALRDRWRLLVGQPEIASGLVSLGAAVEEESDETVAALLPFLTGLASNVSDAVVAALPQIGDGQPVTVDELRQAIVQALVQLADQPDTPAAQPTP